MGYVVEILDDEFFLKTMRIRNVFLLCLLLTLWSCVKDDQDEVVPQLSTSGNQNRSSNNSSNSNGNNTGTDGFISFSTNGQTLPTAINSSLKSIRFEVDRGVDLKKLVPTFVVPQGSSVYANGIQQVSGSSSVDFSQTVTYEIKDKSNISTMWQASAVPLDRKIIIDASHDGGVWWFPQSILTGFDQNKPHQGKAFADTLRQKGFVVDELGRGKELTEEMFFGYYIVIRANGFETYTDNELQVYVNIISRPLNMVFFTDHKKYDPVDELGYLLGLKFEGIAFGTITKFKPHMITSNLPSLYYNAGSVLTTDLAENQDIEILGWLGDNDYADLNMNGIRDRNEPTGAPVMGILNLPKSHIFFIGDMNCIEVRPQPFINNLINWTETGF